MRLSQWSEGIRNSDWLPVAHDLMSQHDAPLSHIISYKIVIHNIILLLPYIMFNKLVLATRTCLPQISADHDVMMTGILNGLCMCPFSQAESRSHRSPRSDRRCSDRQERNHVHSFGFGTGFPLPTVGVMSCSDCCGSGIAHALGVCLVRRFTFHC